ncbi:MAG TPA: UbiA family prenyltransferase, partial [Herpetosiphonaceae bacterium]|nr:UbiA family prenyltransferase [Herpetosiphonaceae bacterium]
QHLFTQAWAIGRVLAAFVLFCLISGCVYLINDLADIETDRQHPRKRLRPLASGRLSPALATGAAAVISIAALLTPVMLGLLAPAVAESGSLWQRLLASRAAGWYAFGAILLSYFVLQIGYTFRLKHVVIVDLFAIAGRFVLRAVGGAAVLQVTITPWWLMCVLLLALFLGLGKRRNELLVLESGAASHRRILEEYSPHFLEHLITIDVACTIIAYSLATFTAPSVPLKPYPLLMSTIPFVIYALFRYMYLIFQRGEGGTPEDLLFKDRPLQVAIACWGLLVVGVMALFGS